MAPASNLESLVDVSVTPRFEVFYALQALGSGTSVQLNDWRSTIDSQLPSRVRARLADVVPSPLMWPLLADALRDESEAITFAEMIGALRAMSDESFQRAVLGGVFKSAGAVDDLISERLSLAATIEKEANTQQRLLSLLGLYPFSKRAASVRTFERIVSSTAEYRDQMVSAVESFWTGGFQATWEALEPRMSRVANVISRQITENGFGEFAAANHLPIAADGKGVVNVRTGTHLPRKSIRRICLLPSAFNTGRLWAAYLDSDNCTRFFIPLLDTSLLAVDETDIDPSTVFKALGDTTRYAIASMLARNPMTSVELARAFDVSKPTISHHVQLLRAAGLLIESPAENGVVLSLNRDVLERASVDAAAEMFAPGGRSEVRRSRRANST
jgi:ArsR family transcriptional regulator, arsenate/arsenite/antimonite-responsive transcriptional repressor